MNPMGADQVVDSLNICNCPSYSGFMGSQYSLFSFSDSKEEHMITGKVSSTPKNAYLRCDGKGFNSSLGGLFSEGNTLSSVGGNDSNLGAHPFASNTSLCSIMECRNSDSDVVTSSTQLELTRQDMRGSSYET